MIGKMVESLSTKNSFLNPSCSSLHTRSMPSGVAVSGVKPSVSEKSSTSESNGRRWFHEPLAVFMAVVKELRSACRMAECWPAVVRATTFVHASEMCEMTSANSGKLEPEMSRKRVRCQTCSL